MDDETRKAGFRAEAADRLNQITQEQLQTTIGELRTLNAELRSRNEALQSANAKLNARVEELSRANDDLSNLLESTQIATVFLDRSLNVKTFTPAAKDVFRLDESDAGRPIMQVRPRFELDTLQEDAEHVLRTLSTVEKPVSSNESGTRYMMRMLPYRTAENVINGIVLTFTDITRISTEGRIAQLAADLHARIAELEALLDLVPVGVMIADNGEPGRILVNTYGARLLGSKDRHKGLMQVAGPAHLFGDAGELPQDQHPLQRAARTGEAVRDWQGRIEGENGRSVHVMISATPLFAEDGAVRGAIAAITNVTPHKQSEEQQQFLLHELQHRVKNILATVSSLATRIARGQHSVDEFHRAFLSRLAAMGRMHDLLASGAWSGAGLKALIERAVEPYVGADSANVRLLGEEIRLTPNAAATMGMVLHELATNASKYGALSTAGGQVEVSWKLTNGPQNGRRLTLSWIERDGPRMPTSNLDGFGTGFIVRSVKYELAGNAELRATPSGVHCTIAFPVGGNVEET